MEQEDLDSSRSSCSIKVHFSGPVQLCRSNIGWVRGLRYARI